MKKKLKLDKKIITQLSENEQSKIKGGNAFTTSYFSCTGWNCCDPHGISIDYTTCSTDKTPQSTGCYAV